MNYHLFKPTVLALSISLSIYSVSVSATSQGTPKGCTITDSDWTCEKSTEDNTPLQVPYNNINTKDGNAIINIKSSDGIILDIKNSKVTPTNKKNETGFTTNANETIKIDILNSTIEGGDHAINAKSTNGDINLNINNAIISAENEAAIKAVAKNGSITLENNATLEPKESSGKSIKSSGKSIDFDTKVLATLINEKNGNINGSITLKSGESIILKNKGFISGMIDSNTANEKNLLDNEGEITGKINLTSTSGSIEVTNSGTIEEDLTIQNTSNLPSNKNYITNTNSLKNVLLSANTSNETVIKNHKDITNGIKVTAPTTGTTGSLDIYNYQDATIKNSDDILIDTQAAKQQTVTVNNAGELIGNFKFANDGSSNQNTVTFKNLQGGVWTVRQGADSTAPVTTNFGQDSSFTNTGLINFADNVRTVEFSGLKDFYMNGGEINFDNGTPLSNANNSSTDTTYRTLDMGGTAFHANGGTITFGIRLDANQSYYSQGVEPIHDRLILGDLHYNTGKTVGILLKNTALYDGSDGIDNSQSGILKIKLIDVNGKIFVDGAEATAENQSQAFNEAFKLENKGFHGLYQYQLLNGSLISDPEGATPEPQATPYATGGGDKNWYLYNNGARNLRADIGAYLANRSAATGLFMHTLHDRVGENQYTQSSKANGTVPAIWIRGSVRHAKNDLANSVLRKHSTEEVMQLGGEIGRWYKDNNRFHLGLMAGYGKNDSKVHNGFLSTEAKGTVKGYSAGIYGTWYNTEKYPTGLYVDVWSQYGWFKNTINVADVKEAKYDSNVWSTSVEAGYAMAAADWTKYQWLVEPQAQIAYHYFKMKDHTETSTNLFVSSDNDNTFEGRMGARTYLHNKVDTGAAQPFVEANWWYTDKEDSLRFNGQSLKDGQPKNRYEVKVGVQGEINKHVQIYTHLGNQWGKNNYSRTEGMLGVKGRW